MKVAVANNTLAAPKSNPNNKSSNYSTEGKISTPVFKVKEHNGGRFLLNRDHRPNGEIVDTFVNYLLDEEVDENVLGHVKLFITTHSDVTTEGQIDEAKLGVPAGKGLIRSYYKNGQEARMISGTMSCWNFAIFPAHSQKNPDLIASFVLSNRQQQQMPAGQRPSQQQQQQTESARPQQDNDIPF